MIQSFQQIIDLALTRRTVTVSVAMADEVSVIEAVAEAVQVGIVKAILVGPIEKTKELVEQISPDLAFEYVDAKNKEEAAVTATKLVSSGRAEVLMKGLVDTSILMKAVLNKEYGLLKGNNLSHVGAFVIPAYHKMLFLTDSAMNIAPNAETKLQILTNILPLCHAMGIETPKIAVLAAKEVVSEKMPATLDARYLVEQYEKGNLQGCIVDGPLAFDNIVDGDSANLKGIDSEVAGDADVILAPQIETGNALYKAFTYFAGAEAAGMILGGTHPIVLTSRADSVQSKINSMALSVLLATKEG